MSDENGAAKFIDAAKARELLMVFLTSHTPQPQVVEIDFRGVKTVAVNAPWGDDTVRIHLPADAGELIDTLNAVSLPTRYSAIWHKDSKLFEVIWVAFPLPASYQELWTRSFVFRHRGQDYECAYGLSTKRLMVIAEHFERAGAIPSSTFYRNLDSLRMHARAEKGVGGLVPLPGAKPISFFIKGIDDWNDDAVLEMVTHLNFFMNYYDTQTPTINIHLPSVDSVVHASIRFPHDIFPATIVSKPIADTLLQFWVGSLQGDPARRFLNNYLIIEYAAAFFLEGERRQAIMKCLSAPNAVDNISNVTRAVIGELNDSRLKHDADKVDALLREVLTPLQVWRELRNNEASFTTPMKFEGGVSIEPLLKTNDTAEEFAKSKGIQRFSTALRTIRNGLSHGRGEKQTDVIGPTTRNLQLLQAWIGPISLAARDAIVFNDVV
jgi:hypothetical protein